MKLSEKAAYIKGLIDGAKIKEEESDIALILNKTAELLLDITESIEDVETCYNELNDYVEEIDEDLLALEDEVYEDVYDDDYEYSTDCPECGASITITDEMLDEGKFTCPACGKEIVLDE